ncbi:hypothetical protein K1T71_008000 [Dendrolimus kikuchii]|uniref:Uncharacterized protein n=1 Tax=Dendrolimus kikuchii TaxID=765133 RepID=A0ACC1CYN5_9NEOP|nr:hypothetical protein K1T71_008000 [Dendrolimus kikuchii]
MRGVVFSIFFAYFFQYVASDGICDDRPDKTLSCTTQIHGQDLTDYDMCKMEVYPSNSPQCHSMTFGPFVSNSQMGGVTLKPYIMPDVFMETPSNFTISRTVLNITFSNIKWKTMRFRFQNKYRDTKNHCRNIVISKDVTIDDKSVLYYDCYWPTIDDKDDQSHTLDFEAANDKSVYRGRYYFNIPSAKSLSSTSLEEEWTPFIYIEIFSSTMRLHILPPPPQLRINAYNVKLKRDCGKDTPCVVQSKTIILRNKTDEVTYDYDIVGQNGLYNFDVTPMHDKCVNGFGCKTIASPKIVISSEPASLNICIASITALIVATLFAYYIVLRVIRRYWCKDPKFGQVKIPTPPKVLVIYSPANRLHAECVASFVTYLRTEYGLDMMYDGDISITSHGDPYIWAEEAFRIASHVMYIVGPAEETNAYNNIYDKPIITPHNDVDLLLLSFVKMNRVSKCPKDIVTVFFDHSDAQVPVEVRNPQESFRLLKDWQKLISYLSKNLLPKRHIMRTEKGRCFIDDLTRASKLLGVKRDDVVVRCDKINVFEKKSLL